MISRQKARNQFLFLVRKAKHDCSCRTKKLALTLWWTLTNKITGTQYHHKLILYSSWHGPRRVLGGAPKSGTGNNQGRRQTTPCDKRGFNHRECHLKRNELSSPVISVSLPLNNSVINPPQLSSVCQQSSKSSHNTPCDNQCLNINHSNSKSNELSSPVIPVISVSLPFNNSVSNPPQLSSVCQQSSRSLPTSTRDKEMHWYQSH